MLIFVEQFFGQDLLVERVRKSSVFNSVGQAPVVFYKQEPNVHANCNTHVEGLCIIYPKPKTFHLLLSVIWTFLSF